MKSLYLDFNSNLQIRKKRHCRFTDFKFISTIIEVTIDIEPLTENSHRLVWIQYLLDRPLKKKIYAMLNLYELPHDSSVDEKFSKTQLRRLKKVYFQL